MLFNKSKAGCEGRYRKRKLIEGNGYETGQSSLLYVFVRSFGLNHAQNTIVVYYFGYVIHAQCLSETKDCAWTFQHKS